MVESLLLDPVDVATDVFGRTRYKPSDQEVGRLANNITLLRKRGLENLNFRLIKSGRKVWDTFPEHNFAAMLCSQHKEKSLITYEPSELQRPPDFKIVIDKVTYWIQIKRFSDLERENRQGKIIENIQRGCKDIKSNMFFDLDLSEDFKEEDVSGLLNFFAKEVKKANVELYFPNATCPKAIVKFWQSSNITLTNLSLGSYGDMDIVDTTGQDKLQIRSSLLNATGAFTWDVDHCNLNFIAVDMRQKIDIDICDAVFGTEFDYFQESRHCWHRSKDGCFHQQNFSNKIAGIIAMKRKVDEPVSDYNLMLLVNESFKDHIENMKKLIPFNKIIYQNMRPAMGQGDF